MGNYLDQWAIWQWSNYESYHINQRKSEHPLWGQLRQECLKESKRYSGRVYRAVNGQEYSILKSTGVGVFDRYVSTSKAANICDLLGCGTTRELITIMILNGCDITDISSHDIEQEVLALPGAKWWWEGDLLVIENPI